MMSEPDTHDFHIVRTTEAARIVSLRPQTLRSLRSRGGGPAFVALSANRVGYRVEELIRWARAREFSSTAEAAVFAREGQTGRPKRRRS